MNCKVIIRSTFQVFANASTNEAQIRVLGHEVVFGAGHHHSAVVIVLLWRDLPLLFRFRRLSLTTFLTRSHPRGRVHANQLASSAAISHGIPPTAHISLSYGLRFMKEIKFFFINYLLILFRVYVCCPEIFLPRLDR
jgi:hypothetical protein